MEWLMPDAPGELASLLAERSGDDGPRLATGAPAPSPEVRRLPGVDDVTVVSAAHLAGEPEVRAGDLTAVAGAGVRIDDLQRELAERGLWLAAGSPASHTSVGGAVALGAAGPWDRSFGDLARQLLACELATWQGTSARWGRAVMKDVAGYGTTRAVVGSFGRLGILVRAAFRVWPAPEASTALELVDAEEEPLALAGRLAASDLDAAARPDAVVWRRSGDDEAAGGDQLEAWLVGPETSVAVRRDRLEGWLETHRGEVAGEREGFDPTSPDPEPERTAEVSLVALRPGRDDFLSAARATAEATGETAVGITGYPLAGTLRCAYRRGRETASTPEGREDGPSAPRPLSDLLEAVGQTPVRVLRGSGAELAAVAERRPERARRLEQRVVAALEGRPRHWLSGYL